jgi:hypothetical protein
MPSPATLARSVVLAALGLLGCQATAKFLEEVLRERPPAPLTAAEITSDVHLDSTGVVLGSLVGEGTSRQVHLLSSDTGFIAAVARRAGVDRGRGNVWDWLAKYRVVALDPRNLTGAREDQQILVGSPDGHSGVWLQSVLLHGSSCGGSGAQAELIVADARRGGPDLRGPVIGSLQFGSRYPPPYFRAAPSMSDTLAQRLLALTATATDSVLERGVSRRERPLSPPEPDRLEVNGLEDVEAADVRPFLIEDGRVRYAVAMRELRQTADGRAVLAATLMVWDSAAVWRQFVFRPTLLEWRRGQLLGRPGWAPLFWRRIEAVSGFAFDRDYLWLEQVDPATGRILWVVLEPRGNIVVAAAEVAGPCLE